MYKYLHFLLTTILISFAFLGTSQSYNLDGTDITDCSGFFYDSGGSSGDYSSNESFEITICSDATSGTHVQLVFAAVELAAGDLLCFYDGLDATAPFLACNDDFNVGSPFIIQATAANPSGCLTVTFNSDGTGESAGWQADMNCIPSCQTIISQLTNSDPVAFPLDTGYIDICQGERVFFNGAGLYPQNGIVYNHSDLTSSFEWDFGDGVFGLGPNVSHEYAESGGYIVQLTITDQFGCTNTNLISQRVRVSTNPNFNILGDIPDVLCAGDTVQLNAIVNDTDSAFVVGVSPVEGSFPTAGVRSDSLALPDGTGAAYETSILFSNFTPGQVLTDVNDLVSICVVMEHSWMRDLEISIQCPDGTSIILHDHPGQVGGEVFLGEPFEADEGATGPIPGVGYEYCWTPDATNGTWIEYANNSLTGGSGTLPAGNYNSFDPLSDLLGCPLNGEWTIHVEDLWGIDNGFIFEWSIEFDPTLYPDIETFTPNIIDYGWVNNPSIFYQDQDSIAAAPQNAGTASYTFTIQDDFGCAYDTSVLITILPPAHPDCIECPDPILTLQDTTICDGTSLQLDAESSTSLAGQSITFEAFPTYAIGNANHPPTDPYAAPLEITSINPGTITNAQAQICGVCLDFETDFDADIRIHLRSPSGQVMELSTNNGGAGDNYTNTCFTPDAITNIVGSAAPFTGNYIPEGDWADLNGSTINGTWELLISDGFGINDFGLLNSWSICFNTENNVSYTWEPIAGLSCYNCPDPVADPLSTSTFVVEVSDDYGCDYTDTMTVNITSGVPAPTNLDCTDISNGSITFGWDEIVGVSNYLVNVNGTGWINANGINSHIITGLSYGDMVTIEVQANIVSASCSVLIASTNCTYNSCDLTQINAIATPIDVDCFGQNTGSIIVDGNGGVGPYIYTWSNGSNDKDQLSLTEGTYTVTIEDANGCTSDSTFIISEPDAITLVIDSTPTTCLGGNNDGTATVTPSGGSGSSYNFTWTGGQVNSTAIGLSPGTYTVLVSDGAGCSATESVMVTAPDAITIDSIIPTDVLCNAGSTGLAEVFATSGNGNLSYIWSDQLAQFSNPANSLSSGNYTVTVTDAALCTATATVFVDEPAVLETTIDPTNILCFGGTDGLANANPTGGIAPYDFAWNTLPGQFTQNIDDLSTGSYTVTVTDFNGCTATQTTIINQPATAVSAVVDQTFLSCFNENNSIAQVTPAGGTGTNYTFNWDDTPNSNSATASGLSPQTYNVTVTDENGCETISNIAINELDDITINVIEIEPSCFGDLDGQLGINIVNGGIGGGDLNNYSYAWDNAVNSALNANIASGNYIVTVTDAQGCSSENLVDLDQPNQITATAIIQDANCFGAADGEILVNANGDFPIASYQWDNNANNQITQTANSLAAGNYLVTITDDTNCSIVSSYPVGQPTEIIAQFEEVGNPCFDDNVGTITTTITGGVPGYSYVWTNADTVNIFSSTDQNLEELYASLYTVTITDGNGCITIDSVPVGAPAPVWVNLEADSVTCFDDQNGAIYAEGQGGATPYTYSLDGENFSSANAFLGLEVGNYSVIVQDRNGCESISTTTVEGPLELAVDLGDNITINYGETATLNAEVTPAGSYFYTWSPTDSLTCLDCQTTNVVGLSFQTTYEVTVTDEFGCRASDLINIYVNKFRRVYVPTGFAPNGFNNILRTHGEEGTMVNSFKVFDRWGELVYENPNPFDINAPGIGWDGNFRGKEMNPGVYIWYLEVEYVDGAKDLLKGHTTLIK